MTHEYVIAMRGIVVGTGRAGGPPASALAWAADRILAVGRDDAIRGISRGDSTFLDLRGCAVTRAPSDRAAAEALLRAAAAAGRPFDANALLAKAGLIASPSALEPGDPADLAFWSADPASVEPAQAASLRLVAMVHAGGFTDGDEHHGPFSSAADPSAR